MADPVIIEVYEVRISAPSMWTGRSERIEKAIGFVALSKAIAPGFHIVNQVERAYVCSIESADILARNIETPHRICKFLKTERSPRNATA